MAQQEADVVVTKFRLALLCILAMLGLPSHAAVLDDDRVDVIYQNYEGGGVEVDAPTILVRKRIGNSFAVSAGYLVDKVSGASIDVEVGASAYEEERKEYSAGFEYLKDKAKLGIHYANSKENDYEAESIGIG